MATWLLPVAAISQVFTLCWGEMDCWDYLISGSPGVPDSALTASSTFKSNKHNYHYNPACGRLYTFEKSESEGCSIPHVAAWCSQTSDPYIQKIVGVVVQHRLSRTSTRNDVRTFNVLYSSDGEDWKYVQSAGVTQTFCGPNNTVRNSQKYGRISPPVMAQYLRIRVRTIATSQNVPCLRFDVIGCNHDTGKRRFTYLPLPVGTISDEDMKIVEAKNLGVCSVRCHRDVTCRSFSYSDTSKQCKLYNVNKYIQPKQAGEHAISDKNDLNHFDMTHVDLYMTTDSTTGLIYKVITREYNKTDAMTACAVFEMKLLVINSLEKLDLVQRVRSSSSILVQRRLRVNGGLYVVDGNRKWWDGGDPPQPVSDKLVTWEATDSADGKCLSVRGVGLKNDPCSSNFFSICEL